MGMCSISTVSFLIHWTFEPGESHDSCVKADTDIVSVVAAIEKTKKQILKLGDRSFNELPTVKRFLDKIELINRHYKCENVEVRNFDAAKAHTSSIKAQLLGLIRDQILLRLEANEIPTLKSASIVLNTEGWESNNDEDEFADNDIRVLFNQFELPLKNTGLTCSLDELLEEWQTLVDYATNYLNHSGLSYTRL